MDKTKVSIVAVIGALVVYGFWRNWENAKLSGKNDQLPAQSEMEYFQSPPAYSAMDGIGDTPVVHESISQTIRNQSGRPILYNGQPMTYPMI